MALHGDIRVNHRKIGEWQRTVITDPARIRAIRNQEEA